MNKKHYEIASFEIIYFSQKEVLSSSSDVGAQIVGDDNAVNWRSLWEI